MASHGYVVIIQDTRGRFDSEGEFYPFRYESRTATRPSSGPPALPYSNGKVGMFGGSYVGATQMLAAMPNRLTWSPSFLTSPRRSITRAGLTRAARWSSGSPVPGPAGSPWTRCGARRRPAKTASAWVRRCPWKATSCWRRRRLRNWRRISATGWSTRRDDDYWRQWKISRPLQRNEHQGAARRRVARHLPEGQHQLTIEGMHKSSTAAADQRLLLGPWAHAETSPEGKVGDVTFGKAAVVDMTGYRHALVRLRAERCAKRICHRRAGAHLCHGRKCLA